MLPQLEKVYHAVKNRTAIIWVDLPGTAGPARRIVRHNLPSGRDRNRVPRSRHQGLEHRSYSYWLLLDSQGRVIQTRFRAQTISQLRQLLNKAE
jgi:hypothetical protein